MIITSSLRTTTPMIRYFRIHDVARLDSAPCPCGRQTPRIAAVEGRVQDLLVSSDGRMVSPGNVCTDLSMHPRMLDHRVVQETPERVRVQLVARGEMSLDDVTVVRATVQSHLGLVQVGVQHVTEIERDPSGSDAVRTACLRCRRSCARDRPHPLRARQPVAGPVLLDRPALQHLRSCWRGI